MKSGGRKVMGGGGNTGVFSILGILIFVFLFAVFMYGEDIRYIANLSFFSSSDESAEIKQVSAKENNPLHSPPAAVALSRPKTCNIFVGEWVLDNTSRPLYKEDGCPFLSTQVSCMMNGRQDDTYQKWRWQPRSCSLPQFDGRMLLEKLRDKRLMFVGDSLNRNQWESMVCLLYSAVPDGEKSYAYNNSLIIYRIQGYNATVEFYWAPFLVESNSDDPLAHSITDRIIMADSIDKHAKYWRGVDYLIFNTYIWWMNTANIKVLRGSFDEGSKLYDEIERATAYERVLRTWARWVEGNVDSEKTTVFFNSMSPLHIRPVDWGNPAGVKCAMEKLPIMNYAGPINVGTDRRLHVVAANLTRSIRGLVVTFIDITGLSEYRKDAHTSVHTVRQGKLLTAEQKAQPLVYADCIHWCLPGLPDTWNELLYARIVPNT
ncbi:protein ESKIMO 1-like [Phalaenopsis equestris]|uniref:protein ESKIMO 1-like n=1 Tax=Phalaenopsis equestris TaxID=78828 RepID=UPI0009E196C5|nr:protein ESKIMO 1-like [Phalaenopsis equestris]